jgi:aquaporin Z
MIDALKQHYKLYLMEAFGLFIFMVSACFFGGMLEHQNSAWHLAISNPFLRLILMGLAMGSTALFIFLSPFTAPSGAFINPTVTVVRWLLGQLSFIDTLWYCIFQTIGGLMAVYLMAFLMGETLTQQPVNYVVTVPNANVSLSQAALMETVIGFIMIITVLFLSNSEKWKHFTPYIAACLVTVNVIVAGPVSGFGMNPSRTIASAIPAHTYTALWIYMLCPFVGMLGATKVFLIVKKR